MVKAFGGKIRMHRKEKGLTQKDLANFLGVSFQTVEDIEKMIV